MYINIYCITYLYFSKIFIFCSLRSLGSQLHEDHPEANANEICNESIFEPSMESSNEYSTQIIKSGEFYFRFQVDLF